ncbi:hypothetical protein M0R45_000646 [Rubus argutus]|uniref:Uncharacterized protein n=1 Tax=Rubus argutus TaxID=59490 RepID=A0AAW1VMP6_RUBAR
MGVLTNRIALACTTIFLVLTQWSSSWPVNDPTLGFLELPLNTSNLDIQRPYNLALSERYSFIEGVHKLWVYFTDKPHSPDSRTHARTEIRIRWQGYINY